MTDELNIRDLNFIWKKIKQLDEIDRRYLLDRIISLESAVVMTAEPPTYIDDIDKDANDSGTVADPSYPEA